MAAMGGIPSGRGVMALPDTAERTSLIDNGFM
jgi:hypothetical protein